MGGGGSNDHLAKGSGSDDNYLDYEDPWSSPQHKAAHDALSEANPLSLANNIEYGGMIYRNRDGKYGYTGPFKGGRDWFNIRKYRYTNIPKGYRGVASYHTHGRASFTDRILGNNLNIFSEPDINYHRASGLDGYLGTPRNRVKYFRYSDKQYFDLGGL